MVVLSQDSQELRLEGYIKDTIGVFLENVSRFNIALVLSAKICINILNETYKTKVRTNCFK